MVWKSLAACHPGRRLAWRNADLIALLARRIAAYASGDKPKLPSSVLSVVPGLKYVVQKCCGEPMGSANIQLN
jgi:hypothetical protein